MGQLLAAPSPDLGVCCWFSGPGGGGFGLGLDRHSGTIVRRGGVIICIEFVCHVSSVETLRRDCLVRSSSGPRTQINQLPMALSSLVGRKVEGVIVSYLRVFGWGILVCCFDATSRLPTHTRAKASAQGSSRRRGSGLSVIAFRATAVSCVPPSQTLGPVTLFALDAINPMSSKPLD